MAPVEVAGSHPHDPTYELPMGQLDHDYERLDNYIDTAQQDKVTQPSIIIPSARQLPNTEKYTVTQCRAYGVIAYKW